MTIKEFWIQKKAMITKLIKLMFFMKNLMNPLISLMLLPNILAGDCLNKNID